MDNPIVFGAVCSSLFATIMITVSYFKMKKKGDSTRDIIFRLVLMIFAAALGVGMFLYYNL